MKNKNRNWTYTLFGIGLLLATITGCKKDDDNGIPNAKSTAVFNPDKNYGNVKDIDGNVYKTITIGTQTWMAQNLRTTHYRNGDPISEVKEFTSWMNTTDGAYCNYLNTKSEDTIVTQGRLYNWYAFSDSRNLAPIGWHLPTDAEWITLATYLGGYPVAGGKMKESGTKHWKSENVGATNESGFTALPCGLRDGYENYYGINATSMWWSISIADTSMDGYCGLLYNSSNVWIPSSGISDMNTGLAVRCIKD
jgi:uncharacterized protein (TIGR02145 family)